MEHEDFESKSWREDFVLSVKASLIYVNPQINYKSDIIFTITSLLMFR